MKSAVLLAVMAALCVGSAAAAANPCRGKKNGSLFPAGGCSAVYYQCFNGKPVDTRATTCAKGLAFNPATSPKGCAEIGAVGLTGCNCNVYSGNKQKACRVCQARNRVGNFPMPGNPRMFVQCTTQGAFFQACNANLRWNQRLQNCV